MGARVLCRTAQPELLRRAGLGRGRANEWRSRRLTVLLALVGSVAMVVTPGASGVPGDPTPPVITPVITGTLGNGGWYVTNVTVNWSISDPESVILWSRGCDATTLTADTSGTTLTCEAASDGGEARVSKPMKVDKTAPTVSASPSRAPDVNGWYNRALTVGFSGSDATSGLASCSQPQGYAGPDSSSTSVAGSCADAAGNQRSLAFALKYDATAPALSGANAARAPDANGWYNHALVVSFAGSDGTSGVETCSAPTYGGPDSATASVSGSCRDRAGNTSTLGSFSFKYDATAPGVAAIPARSADANGWYNRPLSVSFAGSDDTSGIQSCSSPQTYSGPDSVATAVSGSCGDRAGNSRQASFSVKYDATAPAVTGGSATRMPDANGWYNHPLVVSFAGSDATSGVESCGAPSYGGPDSATATVSGTCRDRAGNTSGAGSFTLKYDATAPEVTASPSRAPNANGWYNSPLTVSFSASDATSGVEACSAPQTYAGPDAVFASAAGSCRDRAGNTRPRSLALAYDATAPAVTGANPARAPDGNGWYNRPLTVAFAGSDATSGIESCSTPTYDGPDAAIASLAGSCRDRAGNTSGPGSFQLKYDATAPEVTEPVPSRPPDRAGWYNRPVSFAFQGRDAMSGIGSCGATSYDGPDTATARMTASCGDRAGNTGTATFPLQYDATGPTVSASPSRAPDANGWYNHPLTVAFTGSDAVSGVEACSAPQTYDGPDSAAAGIAGSCVDRAGNTGSSAAVIGFDRTPPTVTGASPGRPPDGKGWYNRPVVVSFAGADSTSGVESCSAPGYSGPNSATASVGGSCRDRAGNVSAPGSFALKYDSTAPSLARLRARSGNHRVALTWQASRDVAVVEIERSGRTIYRGGGRHFVDRKLKNGVRYEYVLTAYDEAGNTVRRSIVARSAALFSPAAGARVSSPPLLAWSPVPEATYYNVQLIRGRKVLSAWPTRPRLRLEWSWTYAGRRYRLTPGRYRWYVWPGLEPRSAGHYGRLVGGSSFVVTGP
jgi:hypothetical protein